MNLISSFVFSEVCSEGGYPISEIAAYRTFSISSLTFVCSEKQEDIKEALKEANIVLFPSKASEVTIINIKKDSLKKALTLLLEKEFLSKTLYEKMAGCVEIKADRVETKIDTQGGLELFWGPESDPNNFWALENDPNGKSQRQFELEALEKVQYSEFERTTAEFQALESFVNDEKNPVNDRAKAAVSLVPAFRAKCALEASLSKTIASLLSEHEKSLTPAQKEEYEKSRYKG